MLFTYHLFAACKYGICKSCLYLWIPGSCLVMGFDEPGVYEQNQNNGDGGLCIGCIARVMDVFIWRGLSLVVSVTYLLLVEFYCAASRYLIVPLLFLTFLNALTTVCVTYNHIVNNKILPDNYNK